MPNKHVHDELSDYLDGESARQRDIARHLQSCPECAQHHMELLKLSNVLQGMPALEVDGGFTDSVLARVDSVTPMPRWQARIVFLPKPVLALAATLVLVALGTWYGLQSEQPSVAPEQGLIANEAWLSDENVIVAVGKLLNTDELVDAFTAGDFDDGLLLEEEPSIEALMDSLAAGIENDHDQPAWYEADDLLSVIELLAEEDVQVLAELTQNHWDEG